MNADAQLHLERSLSAPREAVFAALTEHEQLLRWWAVSTEHRPTIAEIDLVVGGRYRLGMRGPSGAEHVVGGEFHEIEPPRRLVYSWAWETGGEEEAASETVVTIELEAQGSDSTLLRLTHRRFPSDDQAARHREGWCGVLDSLTRTLTSTLMTEERSK